MSQRSRTLLYIGVAALVAAASGIEEVFLNENGVMAIHAPMTEARVGALSTRTATPAILDGMESWFSSVLNAPIHVRNLLVSRTKPEVVERVVNLGYAQTLPRTVSCWAINRPGGHCGACAPCMTRRIACELHSAPDATYEHDVFSDVTAASERSRHDNLVHLCQFVTDLLELDDYDLEFEYPEILSGGSQLTSTEARDMHRRWGQQAVAVLRNHSATAALVP